MIRNPKTVEEYRQKYRLKGESLDDILIELYDHSVIYGWSDKTYEKHGGKFKRLYGGIFIQLNEWLVGFGLPRQNTINKAKKTLKKKVFASIVDVKENNYINLGSNKSLRKYINMDPSKKIGKGMAKDEGYRIFLEILI